MYKDSWLFFKSHALLVLLICVATFLRTFQLDRYAILFPDAGHDLLVAHQALQLHTLPLTGIASSRPWLHQGPVSVWFEMLVMVIFGTSTFAQSLVFALVGIAAVIALYELLAIHGSKTMAYAAVALLAVFPLAIAHSRVPYHTTFIPLATVLYLFACVGLWKKFSLQQLVLVLITWIFLVQFELANALLIFVIPYIFWRRQYKLKKEVVFVGVGLLCLGILPQIIPLLVAQGAASLGWLVSKVTTAIFGHTTSLFAKTGVLIHSFEVFGGRIFSVDQWPVAVAGLIGLIGSFFSMYKPWQQKKLLPVVELAVFMIAVLVVSYWLTGGASEAYFPPFFILFSIVLSFGVVQVFRRYKVAVLTGLTLYLLWNSYTIVSTHFFVDPSQSFHYEGVAQQRAIAHYLAAATEGKPYHLNTASNAIASTPSLFDHISWLALEDHLTQPSTEGALFLVEGVGTPQAPFTYKLTTIQDKVLYKVPQFVLE